jgi:hypothetical protein
MITDAAGERIHQHRTRKAKPLPRSARACASVWPATNALRMRRPLMPRDVHQHRRQLDIGFLQHCLDALRVPGRSRGTVPCACASGPSNLGSDARSDVIVRFRRRRPAHLVPTHRRRGPESSDDCSVAAEMNHRRPDHSRPKVTKRAKDVPGKTDKRAAKKIKQDKPCQLLTAHTPTLILHSIRITAPTVVNR